MTSNNSNYPYHITDDGEGFLKVMVTDATTSKPISKALVTISSSDSPNKLLYSLTTDNNGITEPVPLPAPPKELSEYYETVTEPYSKYNVMISAYGYDPVSITGGEIFDDNTSILPVQMNSKGKTDTSDSITIPPITLWGNYPQKPYETEIKPIVPTGEIVLNKVVIPEYIIVHDGAPNDRNAKDYTVQYGDYIKNVACSEIYATWPKETIKANVIAIMSFTLNRVYSEWYRGKGYYFTITSLPAYDQKWSKGRNFFESIVNVVDEVYSYYVSRPNVKQPILTQYCDGKKLICENALSQWGSKELGDAGYTANEILKYYYGANIYINIAEEVRGIPISWPGSPLSIGSRGEDVRFVQEELNVVAGSYFGFEKLITDGIYGERTWNNVRRFQEIFNLPITGDVTYSTWYKLSSVYVALSGINQ